MSQPCLRCCSAASYAIGDATAFELPVSALVAAFALCVTVMLLLVKLVTDSRKIASTALRGEAGIVLERTWNRFLVVSSALIVFEAFSLFLPARLAWTSVLARVLFSLRQGLLAAPVCAMWGQRMVWLRALLGGLGVAAVFVVLLLLTVSESDVRQFILGRCLVCEHFIPLFLSLFVACCVMFALAAVVWALAGSRVGPRRAVRPWAVFIMAEKGVSVVALGLGLFGGTAPVADAGICIALLVVVVFCVGFALAAYRSFTVDTQILWKVERAGEKAHLVREACWMTCCTQFRVCAADEQLLARRHDVGHCVQPDDPHYRRERAGGGAAVARAGAGRLFAGGAGPLGGPERGRQVSLRLQGWCCPPLVGCI